MTVVIEEKFLNQAIQFYGNEAAGAAETIANGLNALGGPQGIAEVADAFEGYSPGGIGAKASPGSVGLEAAFSSPIQYFQNFRPMESLSQAFRDPGFNTAHELTTFLKNMFEKNGIPNGLAQAGFLINEKSGPSGMEKGFVVNWNPAGANSNKGFIVNWQPSLENSEKGFVVDWAPGTERGIIVQKKVSESEPGVTLSEALQRLQGLAPSTPDEEVGIVIHGFVQNLQNLMKMKPVLESQQSMNKDLSLSGMSNLRA